MVTIEKRLTTKEVLSFLLVIFLLFCITGCAPQSTVIVSPSFRPAPAQEVTYIVPFASALVPETVSETIFNDFVDYLSKNRRETGTKSFVILREEVKNVDPAWLAKQSYISGEVWSYVEDSGCCSTEIRAKARAYLYEAGKTEPSVEIFVPVETIFSHDKSTLERERDQLARQLARELADRIIAALAVKR